MALPEQVLPDALEIDQDKDKRLGSVMKVLAECASVQSAATWVLDNERWDFMGCISTPSTTSAMAL